jgi:hypothetical protein
VAAKVGYWHEVDSVHTDMCTGDCVIVLQLQHQVNLWHFLLCESVSSVTIFAALLLLPSLSFYVQQSGSSRIIVTLDVEADSCHVSVLAAGVLLSWSMAALAPRK